MNKKWRIVVTVRGIEIYESFVRNVELFHNSLGNIFPSSEYELTSRRLASAVDAFEKSPVPLVYVALIFYQ